MTTFQYTLTFKDSEYLALRAALELMIEHCGAQMKDGPKAPYWSHKHYCIKMLERLGSNSEMTSTSSFCCPQPREDE